jgi:hypothetical protein
MIRITGKNDRKTSEPNEFVNFLIIGLDKNDRKTSEPGEYLYERQMCMERHPQIGL